MLRLGRWLGVFRRRGLGGGGGSALSGRGWLLSGPSLGLFLMR